MEMSLNHMSQMKIATKPKQSLHKLQPIQSELVGHWYPTAQIPTHRHG